MYQNLNIIYITNKNFLKNKSFESLSSIKNDKSYFSSENTSFSPSYESEENRENELLNTMKNIEKGKKYKTYLKLFLFDSSFF